MILLKVHGVGIAIVKRKRNAPRSVDMDCISGWPVAPERVKVETGQVHFLDALNDVQPVKAHKNSGVQPRVDP